MPKRTPPRWLIFLGSMELAIALLVMLAIASVIGTFIQQSQPWSDYALKFGPFWFEVYEKLGFYDLYSAAWFLGVLAFLVLSITVCIYRHVPLFWRELKRDHSQTTLRHLQSLRTYSRLNAPIRHSNQAILQYLKQLGFRGRVKSHSDHTLIHATKGYSNRLGYLLTHLGVVIICFGALLDSSIPLQWQVLKGEKMPETRNVAIRDIPETSWLPFGNRAFRGNVDIPEGKAANVVFVPYQDGYFVQRLPFKVRVADFIIERYPTGQPKSFKSLLEIYSPSNQLRSTATISVNHPLTVDGVTLYQSNFGDGGSTLSLTALSFSSPAHQDFTVKVEKTTMLSTYNLSFELDDFRRSNLTDPDGLTPVIDYGPSITFKLRAQDGQAVEYENYQNPILKDNALYYLSGSRNAPSESFTYLYLPADEKHSLTQFLTFLHHLRDESYLKSFFQNHPFSADFDDTYQRYLSSLVNLFAHQGLQGIQGYLDTLPDQQRRVEVESNILIALRKALVLIYQSVVMESNKTEPSLTQAHQRFFDDSIAAISTLSFYPAPLFIQITDFDQVESSGIQITRSLGQPIVYSGCIMLILGIFLLFYIRRGRVWIYQSNVLNGVAMEGMKHKTDQEALLEQLSRWLSR